MRLVRTLTLVLTLLIGIGVIKTSAAASTWETRMNHVFGVVLDVPVGWKLTGIDIPDVRYSKYEGTGGSIELIGFASDETNLTTICEQRSFGRPHTIVSGSYGLFCLILPAPGEANSYAFIPYPQARDIVGPLYGKFRYVIVVGLEQDVRRAAGSAHFPNPPSAVLFVSGALDLWQANHVSRKAIDWQVLRASALAMVNEQSSIDDAYAVLRYVQGRLLELVGDDHGYVDTRTQLDQQSGGDTWNDTGIVLDKATGKILFVGPNSPAERLGVLINDTIVRINGVPVADYTIPANYAYLDFIIRSRTTNQEFALRVPREQYPRYAPPRGRAISGGVGYIETFGVLLDNLTLEKNYPIDTQNLIRAIDTSPRCGWIVDLRRNDGGRTDPILVALEPIIGDGVFMSHQNGDGQWFDWTFDRGAVIEPGGTASYVANPYFVSKSRPPVAVLTGDNTASSGEFSAFVLLARAAATTRSFGLHTRGLTTMVNFYTLYDGGQIAIETYNLGRPDHVLWPKDGITPDVFMETDYATYGTDADPVIAAAHSWLISLPQCRNQDLDLKMHVFLPIAVR